MNPWIFGKSAKDADDLWLATQFSAIVVFASAIRIIFLITMCR
jgi:hypothetical protein